MADIYEHIKELAPFRLEFVDKYGAKYSVKTYIKQVTEDYLLVNPPDFKSRKVDLEDGQEISLMFFKDDGVITSQSRIIGKELGSSSGIKVALPYNSKPLERREFIRVPLKLKVELTKFLDNTYKRFETQLITTRNISGSGLSFITEEPVKDYFDLELKIFLKDNPLQPVIAKGELVYSKKVMVNNQLAYLNAITYTQINEDACARIVKECFKYQVVLKKSAGQEQENL